MHLSTLFTTLTLTALTTSLVIPSLPSSFVLPPLPTQRLPQQPRTLSLRLNIPRDASSSSSSAGTNSPAVAVPARPVSAPASELKRETKPARRPDELVPVITRPAKGVGISAREADPISVPVGDEALFVRPDTAAAQRERERERVAGGGRVETIPPVTRPVKGGTQISAREAEAEAAAEAEPEVGRPGTGQMKKVAGTGGGVAAREAEAEAEVARARTGQMKKVAGTGGGVAAREAEAEAEADPEPRRAGSWSIYGGPGKKVAGGAEAEA